MFTKEEVAAGNPDMAPLLDHYADMWEKSATPFFEHVFESSGLDLRVRELIAIALVSMKGWEAGVRFHAKKALAAGVDPQEIRGAILLTVGIDGMATAARGIKWFDAYLQSVSESGEVRTRPR